MLKDISKEQEKFFREFGEILVKRIKDQSLDASQNQFVDQTALGFAKYLRAARLNAKLTPSELARKALISEAEVYGLERAIISSQNIKEESLHGLASALGEDITIFGLMLGRDIPPLLTKEHVPEQGRTNQDWLAELRGDRGQDQQFMAHQDLADYLYTMAYNYIRQEQKRGDSYMTTTSTPEELAILAQRSVQKTLVKLASDDFALLGQFKGEGRFTSWVVGVVSEQVTLELRQPQLEQKPNLRPYILKIIEEICKGLSHGLEELLLKPAWTMNAQAT